MGYARRLLWFQRELATAPAASAAGLALTLYTFGELFAGTRAWSQGLEILDFVGKSFDTIMKTGSLRTKTTKKFRRVFYDSFSYLYIDLGT